MTVYDALNNYRRELANARAKVRILVDCLRDFQHPTSEDVLFPEFEEAAQAEVKAAVEDAFRVAWMEYRNLSQWQTEKGGTA